MIEYGVYKHLRDDSAVAAIISGEIYPNKLPQEVSLPAIRYATITSTPISHHTVGGTGLYETLMQIDCFSEGKDGGYSQVKNLSRAVVEALHGFSGTMGSQSVSSSLVEDAGSDVYEDESTDHRVMIEVRIMHTLT